MKFSRFCRGLGLAAGFLACGGSAAWAQSMSINLDESSAGSSTIPLPSGGRGGSLSSAGSDFNELLSMQPPYVADYVLDENQYKVGPGDVFQIVVEGSSFERQVNPEGNIVLGRVGVVHLKGLSLKEARKQILDNLETAYKRRNCSVSLSRAKAMRIFITGAVNAPGTYDVAGTARLFDAIQKGGGFAQTAQVGSVEVREGGKTRTVNMAAFLAEGDLEANPYLTQGTVLYVPFLDYDKPWVRIKGDAGSFTLQMEPGETAANLLRKAYSYKAVPAYLALLVREKDGKESLLSAADAARYQPGSQASIEIFSPQQGIYVGGAVMAPGRQAFIPDQKIIEYISKAGITTASRVPRKITVIRGNGRQISLPLQDNDVQPGDVIIVGQNAEQKFLLYTPILLSIVSLALVVVQIYDLR